MNEKSRFNHLTENDLEQVSGGAGVSCETATNLAMGYLAIAQVCDAVGDTGSGMFFAGKASGVLVGGCGRT